MAPAQGILIATNISAQVLQAKRSCTDCQETECALCYVPAMAQKLRCRRETSSYHTFSSSMMRARPAFLM